MNDALQQFGGYVVLNNVRISTNLATGIVALSIFGLLSGIVVIYVLTRIETSLNLITDYAVRVVETTDDLIYATAESHKVALEILADEDPASILARAGEFETAIAAFEDNYRTLDELLVDPQMQSLLETAAQTRIQLLGAVDEMRVAHDIELAEEAEAKFLADQFDAFGDGSLSA